MLASTGVEGNSLDVSQLINNVQGPTRIPDEDINCTMTPEPEAPKYTVHSACPKKRHNKALLKSIQDRRDPKSALALHKVDSMESVAKVGLSTADVTYTGTKAGRVNGLNKLSCYRSKELLGTTTYHPTPALSQDNIFGDSKVEASTPQATSVGSGVSTSAEGADSHKKADNV